MVPRDRVTIQSKQSTSPGVTLNSKAAKQAKPAASFSGKSQSARTASKIECPVIHFDRMLTYKTQVDSTKFQYTKRLFLLKTVGAEDIEQCDVWGVRSTRPTLVVLLFRRQHCGDN